MSVATSAAIIERLRERDSLRDWRCPACRRKGFEPKLLLRYLPVAGMVIENRCPKCGECVTLST